MRRNTRDKLIIYAFMIIIIIIIAVRIDHRSKYGSASSKAQIRGEFNYYEEAKFEKWINTYFKNEVPNLGKFGEAAYLPKSEQKNASLIYAKKAINIHLSNKISVKRKVPDFRQPLCKNVTYDNELPTTSIIIVFYDEAWSVLIRTIYSVLQETPEKLLKEIILIDDGSQEEELKDVLTYYVDTYLPKKVKLFRMPSRQGLIRARLTGARRATGDVLLFLDAHCEVMTGWLPPLLQRVKSNPNTVALPIIDTINTKTLKYKPIFTKGINVPVGGFTWRLDFIWERNLNSLKKMHRSSEIEPIQSPTMSGGLFAIDRKYFWHIGSYDDNMDGWGAENLEISFRIWQCGGRIEIIPCSRVGHIFRTFFPYKFPNNKYTGSINAARTAYVWMDDYKRLFFLYNRQLEGNMREIGSLTDRINLRKKLKCKSFKWYLQNVYPDKFILDENVLAYGKVRSQFQNLCLDTRQRDEHSDFDLGVYNCNDNFTSMQYFSVDMYGHLRRERLCAGVRKLSLKVRMVPCNLHFSETRWVLTKVGQIRHIQTGLCLDATGLKDLKDVRVKKCSITPGQLWKFDHSFINKKFRSWRKDSKIYII